jgi:hypothetical protein
VSVTLTPKDYPGGDRVFHEVFFMFFPGKIWKVMWERWTKMMWHGYFPGLGSEWIFHMVKDHFFFKNINIVQGYILVYCSCL